MDGLFPAFNAGLLLAAFAVVGFLGAEFVVYGGLETPLLGGRS